MTTRSSDEVARIAAELLLIGAAERALQALADLCPVVVYKGAALAGLVYDTGQRPLTDVDLLVPAPALQRARAALAEAGWCFTATPHRPLGMRWHRAFTAVGRKGLAVDVHSHVAQRVRWPVDHAGIFERSAPFLLGRTPALRPCPEDMVLIAALNDAKDEHAHASHGTEDVARIVARLPIDWTVLVARARRWRATVALWVTLERARARCGAVVPAEVMAALLPRRGPALRALLDVGAPVALRRAAGRRLRQAVVGPLLTDSLPRFGASALAFLAVRVADVVAGRVVSGRG